MSYIFEHTAWGFCWWEIPAAFILIVVIAVCACKRHNMKMQERDLEDQLSELCADDAVSFEAGEA